MRTKEEILNDTPNIVVDEVETVINRNILEVLIDIRDVLANPVIEINGVDPKQRKD